MQFPEKQLRSFAWGGLWRWGKAVKNNFRIGGSDLTHERGETLYFDLFGDNKAAAPLLSWWFANHGNSISGTSPQTI